MKVTATIFAIASIATLQIASAQPTGAARTVNDTPRFKLGRSVHPLARTEYDHGRVSPSLRLDRLTLVLKAGGERAAQLDRYLAELQDRKSPNYHRWLTPESYADRFGLTEAEIGRIAQWLSEHDLTVTAVARGRNAISVTGTAGAVERAFQTEIHAYLVAGESHYANAVDPSVPAALANVVAIHGLHDFRMRPRSRMLPAPVPEPRYTSATNGNHYLAPDDFAAIFDIKPVYGAGVDGSGQSIVIVGQSRIDSSHLSTFRSYFGLGDPQLTISLVPDTRDPGFKQRDAQESDLDLEWTSAVARSAQLQFVYSYDVTDAVEYAIDQNLAPVISMSYGACETEYTASDALALQEWARQGNAQGITWIASSGDSGAASCYQAGSGPLGATLDLRATVDMPAAIPEVTAIGGTTFNENGGAYWNATNDPSSCASALSYIPETSWNDSTTNSPASSGGGASQIFGKPSWQTGLGVPSEDARYVPDLAFPASAQHDGYIVYTSSEGVNGWYVFGGTSAGAPAFAGILSLLNQYVVANGQQAGSGLGNINPRVYGLASSSPSAFHDVATGDNVVSGVVCRGFLCSASTVKSVGYTAGTGYDLVTGLGSLDVFAFFSAWKNF